jgi:hypothetical protein
VWFSAVILCPKGDVEVRLYDTQANLKVRLYDTQANLKVRLYDTQGGPEGPPLR